MWVIAISCFLWRFQAKKNKKQKTKTKKRTKKKKRQTNKNLLLKYIPASELNGPAIQGRIQEFMITGSKRYSVC